MVQEIEDGAMSHTGPRQPSVRGISRDRWGDIYANMPVRRMVALYDYDPQEISPNVDAEVSCHHFIQVEQVTKLHFFFISIIASRT